MTEKKYSEDEAKKLPDETDYERLKEMSDQEVEENSRLDPDALTPEDEELKKFKKVKKNEEQ